MASFIASLSDPSRGPILLATAWTGTGLAIVMVALRLYTRITHRNLGWDDAFIVLSLALCIWGAAMVTLAVQHGFGRHLTILLLKDPEDISMALKWAILAELSAYFTTYFIKLSVCFFILRLLAGSQERKRITWILWGLIALMTLVCIGSIVTLAIECTPFYGIWDFTAPNRQCIPYWVQPLMVKIYGAIGAATDIACVLIPVYVVRKLQMKKSIKLTICFLVALGLFTAACSIAKSVTADFSTPDGTWDLVPPAVWQLLEQEIGTIVACAPALRQLFTRRKSDSRPSKEYSDKKSSGNKRSFGFGSRRPGGSSGKTTNISNQTSTSGADTILPIGDVEAGNMAKPYEILKDHDPEEEVAEINDDDSWDVASSDQSLMARPLNASDSIRRKEPRKKNLDNNLSNRVSTFGVSPTATTIRSSFSPTTGQHMFESLPQNAQILARKPSDELVGEPGVGLPSLSDYISPWEAPRIVPLPLFQSSPTPHPAQKEPKIASLPVSTSSSFIEHLDGTGMRGPVPKLKIRPPSTSTKRSTDPRGKAYESLLEVYEEVSLMAEKPKHVPISTHSSQQSLKVPQISRVAVRSPPSLIMYTNKPLPPLPGERRVRQGQWV